MTTITAPSVIGFTQVGPVNLSANFKSQALAAGFVNASPPEDQNGAFDITPPVWDGLAEDCPRWGAPATGDGLDYLWAVRGPGAIQGAQWPDTAPGFRVDVRATDEVKVYINGKSGAWWVAINNVLKGVGSRIRRFPTDLHEGIFPRFCIVREDFGRYSFIGFGPNGAINGGTGLFSPIFQDDGARGVPSCIRVPGTMAPTIAPLFPFWGKSEVIPPVYLGEFMDVMVATDGFATLAEPMPGWMVLEGAGPGPWFVVPKPPAGFVSL